MQKDPTPCTIEDCESPVVARGWCSSHYHRWQRHGDPLFQTKTWRKEACRRGHSNWSPIRMYRGYPVRICLTCQKEWRKTPKARKGKAASARKNAYGITPAEFDALLTSQGGVCAICRRLPVRPSLDHHHGTGAIRGILCGSCNIAIGLLQDSPEILRAAAHYLTQ